MKNVLFVLPALAVMCLANSAQADNGAIDSATLSAMGLSNVQVLSDSQAQDVRGMGYSGGNSKAIAFGVSYAKIRSDSGKRRRRGGSLGSGKAATLDGFLAYGDHYAAGDHISEAVVTKTQTQTKVIDGVKFKTTKTMSLGIGAGGSASSMAF